MFGINVSPNVADYFYITKWKKPQMEWEKLNSSACAKGNPCESAEGSIVRNAEGKVLWGQFDYYCISTNMYSEAKALLQGILSCIVKDELRVEIKV